MRKTPFHSKAVILLYHRVSELLSDPQLLCISPKHFAEHMEHIRKHCYPMSLRELISALKNGEIPKRAVVVTFDDGYADNLHNAKPILKNFSVPATVFVAMGYVGREREFWWDELERLMLKPGILPKTLKLDVSGKTHQWNLGDDSNYNQETYEQHRQWNVGENDLTLRHSLYRSLRKLLRSLHEGERSKKLHELRVWADAKQEVRKTHSPLTADEVRHLVQGDLIEIGSHSVSHSVLSGLPISAQEQEVNQSKRELEQIVGSQVYSFAYPFGTRSDYTEETVNLVQEAGFLCACSNFTGTPEKGADPFQLPRFLTRDWCGDEFSQRLNSWFRTT